MNIVFYSTHCPKCTVLQKKLDSKNVQYTIIDDTNVMTEKGFSSMPVLEVDGTVLQFAEAVKFVNSLNTTT